MTKTNSPRDRVRDALRNPDLQRPDWRTGQPRDRDLLWLDKNENSDPHLLETTALAIRSVLEEALFSYPESAQLYAKLAAWLDVAPDNLLLTAGSDGAIRMTFETFVAPGDTVVITEPTFAMYPVYAKMFGARAHTLPYRMDGSGLAIDTHELLKDIRRLCPKLVCIPNPDSPSGTVLPPEVLREVVEVTGEVNAILLVDEAYHPFYPWTVIPWIREFPHLVVARTFSKAWGLAGLRVGYAAAHPETVGLMHLVRPMYEVNTLAVATIGRMLDHVNEMEASVTRLRQGMDHFLDAMAALGLPTLDSHGNFFHVAFGPHAAAVHEVLASVALYRRDSTFPVLRGYSRFSATTAERFDRLIQIITGVVATV